MLDVHPMPNDVQMDRGVYSMLDTFATLSVPDSNQMNGGTLDLMLDTFATSSVPNGVQTNGGALHSMLDTCATLPLPNGVRTNAGTPSSVPDAHATLPLQNAIQPSGDTPTSILDMHATSVLNDTMNASVSPSILDLSATFFAPSDIQMHGNPQAHPDIVTPQHLPGTEPQPSRAAASQVCAFFCVLVLILISY